MPSLTELVRSHTDLDEEDVAWLQLLLGDWQIIADLAFADLVLWLPDRDGSGYWAGAQIRPTTGPTAYVDDVVGEFVATGRRPLLDSALRHRRVTREGDPEWRDEVPVRVEATPVLRGASGDGGDGGVAGVGGGEGGRVLAVLARSTNLFGVRTPSRLELAYLQTATDLTAMIGTGRFPFPGRRSDHLDSPRVGDGFVRVDEAGVVSYASPNAVSVYRRLGLSGDLTGLHLEQTTRSLLPASGRPDEPTLRGVLLGRLPGDTELGAVRPAPTAESRERGQPADHGTVLAVRSMPLSPDGEHLGAMVLLRDVTELRRRDRELASLDTTIREIHHRVKNNLQTVAALLRMQARRLDVPEGRHALEEAVRRVGSIALVHETLSANLDEQVAFDEVADRLRAMTVEVSTTGDAVRIQRDGSFGTLAADTATPLALVLTELLQNAFEHGLGGSGSVWIRVHRSAQRLRVEVEDDGRGLPAGFDLAGSAGLGLSIVRTLVESELDGRLDVGGRAEAAGTEAAGTRVMLEFPLP